MIRGLLGAPSGQSGFAAQHGPTREHLPAARENVELLSKLELNTPLQYRYDPENPDTPDPGQPQLVPGQIADVSIYKNAAYLASWAEPTCKRGGFFSVDITDPENPEQLAFVPALPGTYHGEGTHTITLNTADFQGDVLAVNNEPCGDNGVGGFDLYDVSDPADPKILVQGFGDQSPDRPIGEPKAPTTQNPAETPNSAHSIFIWQDGAEAFAVIVDNTEAADVDIFNITDPANPEFITDLDLLELAVDQDVGTILDDAVGNGGTIFLHDMVVKRINGQPIMLASYWDIGYIKVNVSDPENPVILGDSAWGDEDPLMKVPGTDGGWAPPEGNAHQAEFSHDNEFVLAADEDFNQFRLLGEVDEGNPTPFRFFSAGRATEGPQVTTARSVTGDTRFVGDACTAANIPPATATVQIAVAERGTCNFQVKTQNAEAAGYRDVIIFNNTTGAPPCEELITMSFVGYTGNAVTLFVGREVGMHIIGAWTPQYTCGGAMPTPTPPAPREGNPVDIGAGFDGWGYMHLYRNTDSGLETVDHFAIEEGADERFALGFGDLTVHEFATDPDRNLAYSSYYSGGLRVMSFGDNGIAEVGKFIDQGGNNFWGVEAFDSPVGGRLIAASDRDMGLYLFRYTGDGAAPTIPAPECNNASAVTAGTAVVIPLSCTDPNDVTLTLSVASAPASGSLAFGSESVTYTPNAGFVGDDTFTYKADNGDRESVPAKVTVKVNAAPVAPLPTASPTPTRSPTPLRAGACANDIAGTSSRDLLKGTSAGERILGGSGNDVIDGGAGDDCLSGQNGNDDLSGDAGNDDVMGGAGTDELAGGSGRDEVDGGTGNDDLDGGSGNDTLVGGSGADAIATGAGTDRVRGGSGNDKISARSGGKDTIDCGAGRDTVTVDKSDKVAKNCEVVRRR